MAPRGAHLCCRNCMRANPFPCAPQAFDAATGTRRWAHALAAGVGSSPAISTSSVYVAAWDGSLYALNLTTGSTRWFFPAASGALVSSPILDASDFVYFGGLSECGSVGDTTGTAHDLGDPLICRQVLLKLSIASTAHPVRSSGRTLCKVTSSLLRRLG